MLITLKVGKLSTLIPLDIKNIKKQMLSKSRSIRIRALKKYKVLERDNFQCISCGSKEDLTIDHYKKNNQYNHHNASAYKEHLCKTLCLDCHNKKNLIFREYAIENKLPIPGYKYG